MLTILEYIWFNRPEVIMQLIEMNKLSAKIFVASAEEKREDSIDETYARLMKHDKWRRGRGGAIRQLHRL
ncbi:MAG TPA: hypothetical protein GXZ97_06360 [Hydrogenispora sp.]|nr:hypothetical protein [Hydrogenispora sp.]